MPIHPLQSLPPSKNIWVGFSGGLDSTVLLHVLKNQATDNQHLRAIHVHHGLQSQADDWANHCQSLCQQWQIPLSIVHVEIHNKDRNTEHKAREARFKAFREILAAGDTLALAHHQDDVAETLLLRLLRGSGTRALANMQMLGQRDQYHIWRPLLQTTRAELEHYAEQNNLRWIDDGSNSDTRFDRNFIRHEILPRLEQRFPNAKQGLAQSAELLAIDAEILKPQIEFHLLQCSIGKELRLSEFALLNSGMQAHVLRAWILGAGKATPTARAIAVFLEQIADLQNDDNICMAYADYRINIWLDKLYLRTNPIDVLAQVNTEIYWDGLTPLNLPRGGTLAWQGDCALKTTIKYRVGGEKIQLAGREIHHAVKKLLSQSVPPWQRDSLPFVYNEQGQLLAVGKHFISETLQQHHLLNATDLHWHSEQD
ncbi:MAG: tRNA lysidine(34) synthetase TilS [Arenimonas sp.]|nr:tRNA lysidine(34) synthetase TilS [Arenimonas sp.]